MTTYTTTYTTTTGKTIAMASVNASSKAQAMAKLTSYSNREQARHLMVCAKAAHRNGHDNIYHALRKNMFRHAGRASRQG